MSFSDLKKRSRASIENLTNEADKINKKSESYKDDRFWRPELDKSSNGFAVIRFLPSPEGEDLPWARLFSHGFQGPGGWYIENSRTTLGEKDPVSEMNTQLWNSGTESDKDIARKRKRRLNYISNILIVSDPANPQNEGKVFLYKYGKKIFDKINEAMQPEFEDEEAINPFDFWKGANFKLKVRKVAGFINYDKSEFESESSLFDGDDAKLEELWKTQYALKEFTDTSNFKSYDELKNRLHVVIGDDIRSTVSAVKNTAENEDLDKKWDTTSSETDTSNDDENDSGDDSEGDALSYFEKLANDD
tara:strand:- start:389 stop:1300 length:912 start_codon:yes stop_codon:yes gene_type:complete